MDTTACASCGVPAPYTITRNDTPTPVCLRHLNHWRSPVEHGYGDTSDCLCGRNFAKVRGLREHITKTRRRGDVSGQDDPTPGK